MVPDALAFARCDFLVVTAIAALAIPLGVAAVAGPRVARALDDRVAVTCAGLRLPPERELDPFVADLAARAQQREAFLALPEGMRPVTFAALGIELDREATHERLARERRAPPLSTRLFALIRAPGEPPRVEPAFRFDETRARGFLGALASELHEDAVDARLDLEGHQRVPEAVGRDLDVPATLRAVAVGERRELAVFGAVFEPIPPTVTLAALASVDVSKVLSSFVTDFSKKSRSRVPNIRRAAAYLNGVVLGPGEVLSFNRVVGPRTAERGFKNAPVIVADELEQGLGGGVCQVASTLFAASMLGGLEIVTRRSHSRPSGYAPLGLDATVIYPEVDLRLRNPYAAPVIIHAFVPDSRTLHVELLGFEIGPVRHSFAVERRDPFARRVVVKSELSSGTVDKRQDGHEGYEGKSTLLVTATDGTRHARRYSSTYYPVPEVYWVAPDVDPRSLPPLPEGARGVELTDEATAADGERGDAREP